MNKTVLLLTIGYIPFLYHIYQFFFSHQMVYCNAVLSPIHTIKIKSDNTIQIEHIISYCDGTFNKKLYSSNYDLINQYIKSYPTKMFYTWSFTWSNALINEDEMTTMTIFSFVILFCIVIMQLIIKEEEYIRAKYKKC